MDFEGTESIDTEFSEKPNKTTPSYWQIHPVMKRFHRQKEAKRAEARRTREHTAQIVRKHIKETEECPSLPEIYASAKKGLQSYDMGTDSVVEAQFRQGRTQRAVCLAFNQPFKNKHVQQVIGRKLDNRISRTVNRSQYSGMNEKTSQQSDMSGEEAHVNDTSSGVSESIDGHRHRCTGRFYEKIRFDIPLRVEELKEEGPIRVEWLNERLAASCRSCRFELPMDMRSLEKMTIHEYLLKYCKISRHRLMAYTKVYNKHKSKVTGAMTVQELEATLKILLVDTVSLEDIQKLTKALKFDSHNFHSLVDQALFAAVCAVAERICYVSYISNKCGVLCGLARGYLECADFNSLDWKLKGIKIDHGLKRFLYSLA